MCCGFGLGGEFVPSSTILHCFSAGNGWEVKKIKEKRGEEGEKWMKIVGARDLGQILLL